MLLAKVSWILQGNKDYQFRCSASKFPTLTCEDTLRRVVSEIVGIEHGWECCLYMELNQHLEAVWFVLTMGWKLIGN